MNGNYLQAALLLGLLTGAIGWAQTPSFPDLPPTPIEDATPGCIKDNLEQPQKILPTDPLIMFYPSIDYRVTVTVRGVPILTAIVSGEQAYVIGGSPAGSSDTTPESLYNAIQQMCNGTPLSGSGLIRTAGISSAGAYAQAPQIEAIGDFNGDGVPDVATFTGSSIAVKLFHADGSTLSQSSIVLPGLNPGGSTMVAADFNMDGKLDLALPLDAPSLSASGGVLILFGNGDGTFAPPQNYPIGVAGYGRAAMTIATADFNGDGIPDLAVGGVTVSGDVNSGFVVYNPELEILLGKGDGTFGSPVNYNVSASSILSADFTGDGILDLAVLDSADKLWLFPGNGDGTFGMPVATPTGTIGGYAAAADINHDGLMDMIIASRQSNAIATLFGNGDGTFQAPTYYAAGVQALPPALAPLPTNDGHTLLITHDAMSGGFVLADAMPDGTVNSPVIQPVGTMLTGIAAADVNNDGQPDLLITDSLAQDFLNPGAPSNLWVLTGTGGGFFAAPVSYPLGTNPTALATGDLNHDGNIDAVVADATGVDILLGAGNGTFAAFTTYASASGQLNSVALGDLNGDGNSDVVGTSANGVSIFLGNGDGTLGAETAIALNLFGANGTYPEIAVIADVNGDGIPDIIVGCAQLLASGFGTPPPGAFAILLGVGDGTFGPPSTTMLPASFSGALAVADVNGDGIPDVIAGASPKVGVYLGNGDGTLQAPVMSTTGTLTTSLTITDLNGDGKPDLIIGECCAIAEPTYMLGNGDGSFQTEVSFLDGPGLQALAIADFNGDGVPDLATVGIGWLTVLMNGIAGP